MPDIPSPSTGGFGPPSHERSIPVTQQQTQSSQGQSQGQSSARSLGEGKDQGPSLSPPAAPDATSPYDGPAHAAKPEKRPDRIAGSDGPEDMEQPYFSEAQSTLGAYAPAERTGDPFAQPEDPLPEGFSTRPTEQPGGAAGDGAGGAEFETASGTVRAGMTVVDSYGHALGTVSSVDGERLRLASSDPHDDGVAFLPVSLIDGIDGNRVLLSGRGDASFGLPSE
jgi:hypothetical protein